jgi:RNA polymerase sigma-70 factor (ECF subfamily)
MLTSITAVISGSAQRIRALPGRGPREVGAVDEDREAGARESNSLQSSKVGLRHVTQAIDEQALVARVADGDVRAYRELVDRHLSGIHAFLFRLMGSRAEAEEVAQETFLKLWSKAGSFVPRAKPSTWLYRVAHNLAVDRLRRRHDTRAEAEPDEMPASGRPGEQLEQKQLAVAVQTALAALPERQRAAIELVHYQGLSTTEAAEVLDVGEHALESLLARARKKLRETLAHVEREQGEGQ